MARQIVRHGRCAMPLHIARRGTHQPLVFQQQTRIDTRIRHLAKANAQVEAFFLQADRPVSQMQLDLH